MHAAKAGQIQHKKTIKHTKKTEKQQVLIQSSQSNNVKKKEKKAK